MNYLGLDVHSRSFTLQHIRHHGKKGRRIEGPTSAKTLIDAVDKIPAPRILVAEECHLAQWVKHTLEPHVDQLIICDPKRNRWISHDDFADDRSSAYKLARLLQGGFIKPVVHPDDDGAELRSLFLHYYDLTHQTTRAKLKLKAVFRQVAITPEKGDPSIYDTTQRGWWLDRLDDFAALRWRAENFYDQLEVLLRLKDRTYRRLRQVVKNNPADPLLQTVPGVRPVTAGAYIALIETPHRFSRCNKLWAYAGLGTRKHDSDNQTYENRSSNFGCRPLKWAVYQQFNGAVSRANKGNRFKRQYEKKIKKGTH
ncbi:MAG: transposase, partial [Phycisphaeraceae bacterium]|nr:transposase [Phycisphaeraceae bacterium]